MNKYSVVIYLLISLIPTIAGALVFLAWKPKAIYKRDKFESQIINIQNGKSVEVEFKKDMNKKEIQDIIQNLKHIKN